VHISDYTTYITLFTNKSLKLMLLKWVRVFTVRIWCKLQDYRYVKADSVEI